MEEFLIIIQRDKRYLINNSGRGIRRLVYTTGGYLRDEDRVIETAAPRYAIDDIPPGTHLVLEEIDPYEDAVVWFRLDSVTWDDGTEQVFGEGIGEQNLWGGGKLPGEKVSREKILLDKDKPGSYVIPDEGPPWGWKEDKWGVLAPETSPDGWRWEA